MTTMLSTLFVLFFFMVKLLPAFFGLQIDQLNNISEDFIREIIMRHGGENGTFSSSEFIDYVDHLHHLNRGFNHSSNGIEYMQNCSDNPELYTNHSELCNSSSSENVSLKCYSTAELLELFQEENGTGQAISIDSITVESFAIICPILLHQLEVGNCSMEVPEAVQDPPSKPSPLEVWGYGFLFVTAINLSAVFGAILLPLMQKKMFHMLLVVLVGLAVGSLSGSAAFHLIPQAYGLLNKNSNHDYLYTSLLILCGIYIFFMVERFLKIFIEYKKRKQESKHEHHIDFKPGQDSAIATVAWMIVFGDGLHNFIDGLSIGAAFNQSILTGISISVAVICEELPHELGDLAVLLNSGMTIKQALLYNFLSACTCYLGLIVGTLLGELAEASMYIFALAGGVFLYISLVDMIPEMNEEVENASKDGVWEAVKVIGLQNLGWITGTAVLFTLAYFTDQLSFE